jgi:hypothetical protein
MNLHTFTIEALDSCGKVGLCNPLFAASQNCLLGRIGCHTMGLANNNP